MVVDSGATSSFVWPEENLPITGLSSKVVNLPDGSTIQATHTTTLPFESLSDEARKADVLSGLRSVLANLQMLTTPQFSIHVKRV